MSYLCHKVVHYLNSKYEDGLLELEELRINHENEKKKVKTTIEQYEAEIVTKNDEIANAAAKLRELEITLEDAKTVGQSELQKVEIKFAKREKELSVSYKTKIEEFVTEAEGRITKSESCFQKEISILQISLDESRQSERNLEVSLSNAKEAHNSEVNQIIRENNARYSSHVANQLSVRESLRKEHAKAIQDIMRTEHEKACLAEKRLQNTLVAETEKALGAERIRLDQVLRDSKHALLESLNQAKEEAKQLASEKDAIINKMRGIENEMVNLAAIGKTRVDAAEGHAMKLNAELMARAIEVEELATRLKESRNEIERLQLTLTADKTRMKADFEKEHSALKLELTACRSKAKNKESNLLMESKLTQDRVDMMAEDSRSVARSISEKKIVIEGNLNQILESFDKARTAAKEDAKRTAAKTAQNVKKITDTVKKLEAERYEALRNANKTVREMEEKHQFMLITEQQKYLSIHSELTEAQKTVSFLEKEKNRALIVAGLKAYAICKAHKETRCSLLKEAEKTKELNGLLEVANARVTEETSRANKWQTEVNMREKVLREQFANEWSLKLEEQRILHQQELKSNLIHSETVTKKLRNDMTLTINVLTKELEVNESRDANTRKLYEKALLVAEADATKLKALLQHETQSWSREREALLSSVTEAQEKANADASCLREELQEAHITELEKQSAIHLQAIDALKAERIESYECDISTIKQKLQREKLLSFHRLENTQSELDAVRLEATFSIALTNQKLTAQMERNETLKAQHLNQERMRTCDVEARLEREFVSFSDMKSTSKAEVERMKVQIKMLQDKYSRRPSRQEDSLLIGHLEKEVSQKTAVLEKAMGDIAYIKHELINREQNYNKKFNSSSTPVAIKMTTGNGSSSSQPSYRSVPVIGRPSSRPFSHGRRRSSQGK